MSLTILLTIALLATNYRFSRQIIRLRFYQAGPSPILDEPTVITALVTEQTVFLYLFVCLWTHTLYAKDLLITILAPIGASVFFFVTWRSLEPTAGSWALTGAYTWLELRTASKFRRVFLGAWGPVSALIAWSTGLIIVLEHQELGYRKCLTLAGFMALGSFILGASYSTQVLLHPVMQEGSRLRLLTMQLTLAAQPATLLSLGAGSWPFATMAKIPKTPGLNWLLVVLLGFIVVLLVWPSISGSQRRSALLYTVADWEYQYDSRCASELRETGSALDENSLASLIEDISARTCTVVKQKDIRYR